MKKFKLIIDASNWKVFGFDALSNKDFYAGMITPEVLSNAFHEKYDRTINSAASIKRNPNAEDYINRNFEMFFVGGYDGKSTTAIKWNDMLIKNIRQYISIHYITRYLKPWFCKQLDSIEDVKLTDLVLGTTLSNFELTFTLNEEIDEETFTNFVEGIVGSFDTPVMDGLAIDPEKFVSVCKGLQEILVNEMVKNLNPSFTKFVKGFLKG